MDCPRCHTALTSDEVEGVAVSRCPTCDGLWFTEANFHEAKDHAEPHAAWMDFELWRDPERFTTGSRAVRCPACSKTMVPLRYGETGVEIDTCPRCRGVWLDGKEFENILAALEDELARMPARELLAEALREAGEIVRGSGSTVTEWRDVKRVLDLLKLRVLVDHPTLARLFLGFEQGTPFT